MISEMSHRQDQVTGLIQDQMSHEHDWTTALIIMSNGISHHHQLNQSISVLRDLGLYFSFLFKF